MTVKFPSWANNIVTEVINENPIGGERQMTVNRDDEILTTTIMNNGFLKDTLPTNTLINSLFHAICYYLNRPEEFTELPAANNPLYLGRIVTLFTQNQRRLFISDGSNWHPIRYSDDQ